MISVIIPCYNCAGFLQRAVESVMAQSYTDWEIILVNNNSTDNTADVIDAYTKRYPQVITGVNETIAGSAAARNKGLLLAKGEWVQFLDADDALHADRFATLINTANAEACDIITTDFVYVDKNGNSRDGIVGLVDTDVWVRLIRSQLGRTSAMFWKRNVLEIAGGWDMDKSSSQEYYLLFKALRKGAKLVSLSAKTATVYETPDSISRSVSSDKQLKIVQNYLALRKDIKNYLNAAGELNHQRWQAIDSLVFENNIQYFRLAPLAMFFQSLSCKFIPTMHRLKCYKMVLGSIITK